MADTTKADIKEKGHEPDKGDHCPHCAGHEARIGALETHLGMKPEKGVSKEESGKVPRERKRH